jgi:hypothetical protein
MQEGTTKASVSTTTHQKAKVISAMLGMSILEFYDKATEEFMKNCAKQNKAIKEFLDSKKG